MNYFIDILQFECLHGYIDLVEKLGKLNLQQGSIS